MPMPMPMPCQPLPAAAGAPQRGPSRRRTALGLCQGLAALGLCWLLGLAAGPTSAQGVAGKLAPASAQSACPPTHPVPSAEQVRQAAVHAHDKGMLWRLRRDGRESWLYGTLHVGRLGLSLPGPMTRQALLASDLLALELDPTAPNAAADLVAAGRQLPQMPWPPALLARLARAEQAACLPDGALAALHPLLRATTLVALDARWVGLDPGWGVELVLGGFMRQQGRPTVALETVAQQLAALQPEQPEDALAELSDALDRLETGADRPALADLAQAWADGDLDALGDLARWCHCKPSAKDLRRLVRLNDARNPGLAERIAALHDQGQRVFAAVGALHMTGPAALPLLLAQRGFEVERLH